MDGTIELTERFQYMGATLGNQYNSSYIIEKAGTYRLSVRDVNSDAPVGGGHDCDDRVRTMLPLLVVVVLALLLLLLLLLLLVLLVLLVVEGCCCCC